MYRATMTILSFTTPLPPLLFPPPFSLEERSTLGPSGRAVWRSPCCTSGADGGGPRAFRSGWLLPACAHYLGSLGEKAT